MRKTTSTIRKSEHYKLPAVPKKFTTLAQVERYVNGVLKATTLDLVGWRFRFNNSVRCLGLCRPQSKYVELSRQHVARFMEEKNYEQICRTTLHEVAHALANNFFPFDRKPHGLAWKRYCTALGIPGERAAYRESRDNPNHEVRKPRGARWALVNRATGVVYRYYNRQPKERNWGSCWLTGRKHETFGMLALKAL